MIAKIQSGAAPPADLTALEGRAGHSAGVAGLSALVDAAHELAAARDEQTLLAVVARRGRRLLNTALAFVATVNDKKAGITVRAVDGFSAELGEYVSIPGHERLAETSLRSVRPLWTHDSQAGTGALPGPGLRELARREGLHAMITIRLGPDEAQAAGRATPVLYLADRRTRWFTMDECELLVSFAGLAGAALENVRLLESAVAEVDGLQERSERVTAALDWAESLRSVHYTFIEVAVAGADAQALVTEADRQLDGVVSLYTADDALIASSRTGAGRGADAEAAVWRSSSRREMTAVDERTWAVPVLAGGERLGTLLIEAAGPLGLEQRKVLPLISQAAAVILRQQGEGAQEQARRALLDDLISETAQPQRRLIERARMLKINVERSSVVVVLRPNEAGPQRAATWAAKYAARNGGLSTVRDGDVVLWIPAECEADAAAHARAIVDESTALFGRPVTAAASALDSGPGPVAEQYRQAAQSLEVMTKLNLAGHGASVQELGFLHMLLAGHGGIDQFTASILGPVLDYDRRRGAHLTKTLDAYFRAGASPTNAADLLHVHPNTVARRLERVKQLLAVDWQDPAHAFDIQLALRLHRLLTAL